MVKRFWKWLTSFFVKEEQPQLINLFGDWPKPTDEQMINQVNDRRALNGYKRLTEEEITTAREVYENSNAGVPFPMFLCGYLNDSSDRGAVKVPVAPNASPFHQE